MKLNDDAALVIDHGLFPFVPTKLGEYIDLVGYFTHWENVAPTPDKDHIGYGLDGVDRVESVFDFINDERPGLIVFPDVGHGDWQEDLRAKGFSVFGTSRGEILEDDRIHFRKVLKKLGLPCSPYEVVTGGIEELREKLKKVKDKYIKISMYRGIGETFHHEDYETSKTAINGWAVACGVLDKEVEFIIEDPIKAFVENVAMEWFLTDKGYLSHGLWGIENKNSAYLGKKCAYKDVPKNLLKVAEAFLPVYKKYRVRGGISLEGHVTEDGKFWYDDPCMRLGSPPAEAIVEAYDNLPDIMKSLADGELIDVDDDMPYNYVAEIMLQVRESPTEPIAIEFPKKVEQYVKLRNLCKIDGRYYNLPQEKETILGAAVGVGKTIEEAQENALSVAKEVKGCGVYYDKDGFEDIAEQLKKAERVGMGRF